MRDLCDLFNDWLHERLIGGDVRVLMYNESQPGIAISLEGTFHDEMSVIRRSEQSKKY